MPKAEWGAKRTCPNCETRFYDLRREPILCPECGATFSVDNHGKVSALRERRAPVPVSEDEDALVDDEDLVEDAEEDEVEEDPLLADEDEEEEPAGPALSDEDGEEDAVAFQDAGLIDEDELDEEVEESDAEEEDELDDLDDVPGKDKAG
jgi:uncharacterized protein (TIGR02300 family)